MVCMLLRCISIAKMGDIVLKKNQRFHFEQSVSLIFYDCRVSPEQHQVYDIDRSVEENPAL